MRVAINQVKSVTLTPCVGRQHRGLDGYFRFVLKMLPGIDRPCHLCAIANGQGHTIFDLGPMSIAVRSTCCSSASWGHAGCRDGAQGSANRWSLNIGEEEIKGNEVVKAAANLLRASGLNFVGNVEGDGIYKGDADVVVCDGFVGNVR